MQVGLAMANPIPWPATPNQDKPTLTIESPQNNTEIDDGFVYLNFTVTKPDSWDDPQWFIPYIGQIRSVKAYFDENRVFFEPSNSEGYSVKLNLNQSAQGIHTLNVTVLSHTYYRGPAYNGSHMLSSITSSSGPVYEYPVVVFDIVYFTVDGEPSPPASALTQEARTFSTATVAAVSVAAAAVVVGAGLLVYFKKHKNT